MIATSCGGARRGQVGPGLQKKCGPVDLAKCVRMVGSKWKGCVEDGHANKEPALIPAGYRHYRMEMKGFEPSTSARRTPIKITRTLFNADSGNHRFVIRSYNGHIFNASVDGRLWVHASTPRLISCHGAQRNVNPMLWLVKHAFANLTNIGSPHRYQASYAALPIQKIYRDLSPLPYSCWLSIQPVHIQSQ